MADEAVRKLELGRVFSDTFGVIRRQFVPLAGFTLLLGGVPAVVRGFAQLALLGEDTAQPAGLSALSVPFTLIAAVLGFLLYPIQLRIAQKDLEGERVEWREVLRSSLRKVLPVFAVSVLFGIGVAVGIVFLVVPALILATMWAVSLPVVVNETSNPFSAFGRSRALTRGNRWRIFGLWALIFLGLIAVQGVMISAIGGVGGLMTGGAVGFGFLIAVSLISLVVSIVVSVASAALYVQLRELKGAGRESVAQVFA